MEIINSVEVPSDVESVLGLEQLDQLQDLAGKAPVHLESLPQEPGSDTNPCFLILARWENMNSAMTQLCRREHAAL